MAGVSLLEALAAAALIAALLYAVDRGMAFHVCLYAAIASGKRFTAEDAYKAMNNPFSRGPRLVLWVVTTVAVFVLVRGGGIGDHWAAIGAAFVVALAFVAVSGVYAFKSFRRTSYGVTFADAVKQGRWRDN